MSALDDRFRPMRKALADQFGFSADDIDFQIVPDVPTNRDQVDFIEVHVKGLPEKFDLNAFPKIQDIAAGRKFTVTPGRHTLVRLVLPDELTAVAAPAAAPD